VLTGVDLTSWGQDQGHVGRLGALVSAILRETGLPRLRLSSVDGVEIDEELFDLLASEERVMPHLHLSLQHGDDLILKRMKRRHRAQALALVARLKARRDVAVGADIIAGFPTEDAEAHAANLSAIAEMDIVHGHIFPYSARPGTPAALMPQVAAPVIAERAAAIARSRGRPARRLAGAPCRHRANRAGRARRHRPRRQFRPRAVPIGHGGGHAFHSPPPASPKDCWHECR
jgi:threonylcarbamoyladenosine tRNA methylthiotransferase MtaB